MAVSWLRYLADALSSALTGKNAYDLLGETQQAPSSSYGTLADIYQRYPEEWDKRAHAYGSYLSGQKWGGAAKPFVYGKEIVDIPHNIRRGEPWFSWGDLLADQYGFSMTSKTPPYADMLRGIYE